MLKIIPFIGKGVYHSVEPVQLPVHTKLGRRLNTPLLLSLKAHNGKLVLLYRLEYLLSAFSEIKINDGKQCLIIQNIKK